MIFSVSRCVSSASVLALSSGVSGFLVSYLSRYSVLEIIDRELAKYLKEGYTHLSDIDPRTNLTIDKSIRLVIMPIQEAQKKIAWQAGKKAFIVCTVASVVSVFAASMIQCYLKDHDHRDKIALGIGICTFVAIVGFTQPVVVAVAILASAILTTGYLLKHEVDTINKTVTATVVMVPTSLIAISLGAISWHCVKKLVTRS